MNKIVSLIIILTIAFAFTAVGASPVSAGTCISYSGDGDVDVFHGPLNINAGTTVTITMTTPDGAGTAILIYEGVALIVLDVEFTATHTLVYTFAADALDVQFFVDWEYNGLPENTYSITSPDCPSAQPAPQAGMVSISQGQPVYDSAGGNVVRDGGGNELWLPQDYDGSGADTHLVMSSTTVDGRTWYEIWIGDSGSTVWIPADGVTVVE